MGTHINFNNLGSGGGGPPGEEGNNQMKPMSSATPLARQSSLYSLTFDELQSTLGGPVKDLGSMNIDELLKSIWTAEEAQVMAMNMTSSAVTAVAQPGTSGVNLPRQGSLTLPRTFSQKTVDEVWKCLNTKESVNGNIGNSSGGGGVELNALPRREPTLGETTLEEFLFRAGAVREDNCSQQMGQATGNNNNGFYGNNRAAGGLGFVFGQPNQNSISFNCSNDSVSLNQPPSLGLQMSGTIEQQQQQQHQFRHQQLQQRQQLQQQQRNPQQQQQQRLPQAIFPKQANVAYSPVNMINKSFTGAANNSTGLSSFGGAGVTVAVTSPGTSSAENNSLSPVPYVLNRGRRSNTGVEKVIERRQRRMIKNRESAARSRARKQAYTLELEVEIENLKKENQELKRKQIELMEIQNQKKQKETSKQESKRQCLRRTQTSPW